MLSRNPEIRKKPRPFSRWLEEIILPSPSFSNGRETCKGKELFNTKTCMICHEARGTGINFGPGLPRSGISWMPKHSIKRFFSPARKSVWVLRMEVT